MSFNVTLYRKYRPKSFTEIHGQEFVVKTLRNSIINNKLSHAYILSGSRGIGKTSIAKIFAKAINCLQPIDGDCCNQCNNCLSVINNTTLDILEIDAASNNGVGDVRNWIDNINYLPSLLKYKVYIIDEAHMLTNGAWNALLKTIEDPPKHLIFVFATTEPHKIPLTIISRCQKFSLSNLSLFELEKIIKEICEIEQIEIKNDAIKKIAYIASGSVRDCLTYLGQIDTYTNSKITVEAINQIFGLLDIDKKIEFINYIINYKFEKIIESIKDFEFKGIDFYQLAIEIIEVLFDKLVYEKTHNDSLLKVLSKLNLGTFELDSKSLIKLIEVWQDGLFKMKTNSNPRFYFELTCLTATKVFDVFNNISTQNTTHSIEATKSVAHEFENKEDQKVLLQSQTNSSSNNVNKTKNETLSKDGISIKKIKNDSFTPVNFNDVVTKRTYGNSNEVNNINYIKLSNNKVENTSLEKLNTISELLNDKEEIESKINHISTPFNLDISEIIKNSISTKPFQNNLEIKDKNLKQKNTSKKQNVVTQEDFNLFNMNFDDEPTTESVNFQKEIQKVTNIEKIKEIDDKVQSNNKNNKEKIINDFKNNLKSIATIISSDQKNNSNNSANLINSSNITINEYSDDDKYKLFCQIADNNDNNIKGKICNIFSTIKGKVAKTLEEGYFVNADKILLTSPNGIIILFDEQIACKNLNSNFNNVNFLKYVSDTFKKMYLFLALTKTQAHEYANKYKEHLKNKQKLEDVNIDDLLDKINKKETLKDLAINMLGDLIEEEK